MANFFKNRTVKIFLLFAFIDIMCVGAGMGVPIFCILLGFVIGWYGANKASQETGDLVSRLRRVLQYGMITSGFTFLLMAVLWGPFASVLFDPNADYEKLGIPYLLFDPKASLIGWLILMIIISPFLQLLTTVFGSHVTFLWRSRRTLAAG